MEKNNRIAICYDNFAAGGSTTSLLAFLNSIDYSKYDIDLYVYENTGGLKARVNENVNIFEVGKKIQNKFMILLYSIFSLRLFKLVLCVLFSGCKNKNHKFRVGLTQIASKYRAKKSLPIKNVYEFGIGYMEFWSNDYVILQKTIKNKILWFHSDYIKSNMNLVFDNKSFKNSNKIVVVSESCLDSFNLATNHKYEEKTIVIENLVDVDYIRGLSLESIDDNRFCTCKNCFVTVARLDKYTKGLDRCIEVALKLKKLIDFKWFFIGDGPDYAWFRDSIYHHHLQNNMICLGFQKNPYKYIAHATAFILLSRYEGKPIVIQESQILSKCCIVTNYASAKEQIINNKTGIICSSNHFDADEVVEKMIDYSHIISINEYLKTHYYTKSDEYPIERVIDI